MNIAVFNDYFGCRGYSGTLFLVTPFKIMAKLLNEEIKL